MGIAAELEDDPPLERTVGGHLVAAMLVTELTQGLARAATVGGRQGLGSMG